MTTDARAMVVTDDFVYIHLPKTGGTFVEHTLRTLLEATGAWYLDTSRLDHRALLGSSDQHESVREIPADHRSKPVLFTIRNPYDWYVSQYEFAWWKVDPDAEFDGAAARKRYDSYPDLSFREFVAAINDPRLLAARARNGAASADSRDGIGALTSDFIRLLSPSPDSAMVAARAHDLRRLRAALHPEIHVLRTETLRRDLHDWLVRRGFTRSDVEFIWHADRFGRRGAAETPPPGEQAWITSDADLTNPQWTASWRRYYDAELKAFVRRRERLYFELFPEFN